MVPGVLGLCCVSWGRRPLRSRGDPEPGRPCREAVAVHAATLALRLGPVNSRLLLPSACAAQPVRGTIAGMLIPTRTPEPRPQLSLRVTPDQRARLLALAAANGVTLSRVLEFSIERLLADADLEASPTTGDAEVSGPVAPVRSASVT